MKKKLSVILLAAVLLCSCSNPNVDTSSQDESSTQATYASKGAETVYAKNQTEVLEKFESLESTKSDYIRINANTIMPVYEYSLNEYAETGKIVPRLTERYLAEANRVDDNSFCNNVCFIISGDHPGIYDEGGSYSCDYLSNIDSISDFLSEYHFDPETLDVKSVDMGSGVGYCFYISDRDKAALVPIPDFHGTPTSDFPFFDRCSNYSYRDNMLLLSKKTLEAAKTLKYESETFENYIKENYTDKGINPPTGLLVNDFFNTEPDSDRELIKKAVALFDDDRKLIYNDAEKLIEEYPDLIINTGNTGGPSFNFGGKKAYWLCPPYNAELMNRERFEAFINNYQNRTADMIYILSPSGTAVVDYSGETDRYTVAVYKVKDGEVLLLNVSRFALYETDRSYYITDNSDSLIVLPKDKNYKPVAVSDKALSDIEIADRLSELIGSERKFHFEEEAEINGELCKCFVSGENTESYVIYAVSPDLKKIYRGGFPDGNWWLIAE